LPSGNLTNGHRHFEQCQQGLALKEIIGAARNPLAPNGLAGGFSPPRAERNDALIMSRLTDIFSEWISHFFLATQYTKPGPTPLLIGIKCAASALFSALAAQKARIRYVENIEQMQGKILQAIS